MQSANFRVSNLAPAGIGDCVDLVRRTAMMPARRGTADTRQRKCQRIAAVSLNPVLLLIHLDGVTVVVFRTLSDFVSSSLAPSL